MQLLSILGIGFAQGLYALDAADGQTEHAYSVSPSSHTLQRFADGSLGGEHACSSLTTVRHDL